MVRRPASIAFRLLLAGYLLLLPLLAIAVQTSPASALAAPIFSTSRDCSADAVVFCGAMTASELIQKYNVNPSIGTIYAAMGISNASVLTIANTAVAGLVRNDGTVTVDGHVVATGGISASRQSSTGGTPVSSGGVTFFKHPAGTSVQLSDAPAFVAITNNTFRFAIIASNGDPVSATPIQNALSGAVSPAPTTSPSPQPFTSPAPVVTAAKTAPVFNTKRDCDANAVINCGALSVAELTQKYNTNPSISAIFAAMGITSQDVMNLNTTAVAGQVHKDGTVTVNSVVVATKAISAGRTNFPGSTPVTVGSITFFKRPPSVSFASDNLDAFVVISNNTFKFAILASCGNPVIATAVPPPVKPAVQPQPTPTPAPTPAPTPPPTPTPLPNTGPEHVMGIFLITSGVGTEAYQLFLRKRRT